MNTNKHLRGNGGIKEFWRRFRKNKSAVFGLALLTILILASVFANVIADPSLVTAQDASIRLQGPSSEHWFGTDQFGRDIFARVVHATPVSLMIGVSVAVISLILGSLLGVTSAYFGGKYDDIMMRVVDVISSIPGTLMAMVIVAVLGANMQNMIIALVFARIRSTTRLSRSAVFGMSGQEFIDAARAGGASHFRIIMKHIIPNISSTLIVDTTMNVSACILQAAALSFLGLGVQPPTPEWGSMLNDARSFMRNAPHIMIFPGLAILFASLSINLVGDGMRDVLDPRLKS